ncbi:MAG TPA: STAS domain-containing protein [Candidatus Eremiobacteraceae bacterium]|jgi:anti-anti-sigma factor
MIESVPAPIVSAPTGHLDDTAGDALVDTIKGHIERNEQHHILDLRAVHEVDARTIRTIITIHRKIVEIGGSVRLVIENPKALRYIKLTALARVFGVYPTPEDALAGFVADDRNAPL